MVRLLKKIDRRWHWPLFCLCLVGGLTFGWLFKLPCRDTRIWDGRQYRYLCYTDLIPLWSLRNLETKRPYLDNMFEYPVLSGEVTWFAASFAHSSQQFFDHMVVILSLAGFLAGVGIALIMGGPAPRAFLYALAPSMILYAFHNFELFACLGMVGGYLALQRKKYTLAGFAFGLGAAAKLYPGVLGVGAAIILSRNGKRREALLLAGASAATFALANLPFVILNPTLWWETYSFHSKRYPDWGSIFLWISRSGGIDLGLMKTVADISAIVFMLAAIAILWLDARRAKMAPEIGAAWLLVIFLITNKVWSPQYMLWILPLFFILEVRLRWFVLFSLVDLCCYVGVFEWFGHQSSGFWTHFFEISVWVRFFLLIAFAWELFAKRPQFFHIPDDFSGLKKNPKVFR